MDVIKLASKLHELDMRIERLEKIMIIPEDKEEPKKEVKKATPIRQPDMRDRLGDFGRRLNMATEELAKSISI